MYDALEPLLSPLLLVAGAVVLAMLVMLVVVWVGRKKTWKKCAWAVLVLGHALMVGCLLLFWVNAIPGFFEENRQAVHVFAELRELGRGVPDPMDLGVDLLLVDQTKSKVVVNGKGRVNAGSGWPITDRAQLADMINLLADHKEQVALVICDIVFDRGSEQDSALATAIRRMGAGKVLIAGGAEANTPALEFGPEIKGDATIDTQNGMVVRQSLVNEEGIYTLPYLMYTHYAGITARPWRWGYFREEETANGTSYAFPYVIPYLHRLSEGSYTPELVPVGGESVLASTLEPIELRHATTALKGLVERRLQGSRSPRGVVVFIGEFLSAPQLGGTDVHPTFRGNLHGSTILLNQFLSLVNHDHHVKWGWLIVQFLLLCAASAILFSVALPEALKHKWQKTRLHKWISKGCQQPGPRVPVEVLTADLILPAAWDKLKGPLKKGLVIALLVTLTSLLGWWADQPVNGGALVLYFVILFHLICEQRSSASTNTSHP